MRRFPGRYIDSIKSPDGRLLWSNREICDAFWTHFRDRFARCPDLPLQGFCSYLADFPRLGAAKAVSCEGVNTECEVCDALKQVGLKKSPGLDGLPTKCTWSCRTCLCLFWRIFSNVGLSRELSLVSVTKGMITLLKKGGKHVWEGLNDYRPITLLNTELNILARVLVNCLQVVISDLIGSEQIYAVKEDRSRIICTWSARS